MSHRPQVIQQVGTIGGPLRRRITVPVPRSAQQQASIAAVIAPVVWQQPKVVVAAKRPFDFLYEKKEFYNLSDAEINRLLALRWKDGTLFFDESPENRPFLYDLVASFHQIGRAMEIITELERLINEAAPADKNRSHLFNNLSIFVREKAEYFTDKDRLRRRVEVVRGSEPCPKCGSYQTDVADVQTRSGDESMTHTLRCLACGYYEKKT